MNEHADRDHSEQPAHDERMERYAEAVAHAREDGLSLPDRFDRAAAHYVLAVADAELAEKDATIAALRAEVDRLRLAKGPALFEEMMDAVLARAERAEAARTRVEALPQQWAIDWRDAPPVDRILRKITADLALALRGESDE